MSVEAILTVVTVALAVLAVIPQERGYDLRVRLGGASRLVWATTGLLVLYWALLEQIHGMPGVRDLPRSIPWLGNWTPATASLSVMLGATLFAWWSYRRRLPVYRTPRLAEIMSDALARRRYGECLHLVETHLETVRRSLDGDYWQLRLRTRLFPTFSERFLKAQRAARPVLPAAVVEATEPAEIDAEAIGSLRKALEARGHDLRHMAPPQPGVFVQRLTNWADRPQNAAADLVRALSLAPGFIREVSASHPYLGARLLELNSTWSLREYAEGFARAQLSDPDSVLYRELRRADNLDRNGVPVVDLQEQPLLSMIRADACREEGPRLLYTFLDAGIEPLRAGGDHRTVAGLNGPLADYAEHGRWHSPPFATIHLLRIVAPHAAVNPKVTLLNLFVLDTLVSAVLAQLHPSDDVDLTREWPTPSHHLLYESVSLLRDLVRIGRDRPDEMRVVLDAQAGQHEPLTLPQHAIQVLGRVMYDCLRSDRLNGRFKGYLLSVWWSVYWTRYKDEWAETNAVLDALASGGQRGPGDMAHRDGLAQALEHLDTMDDFGPAGERFRRRFEL